jgi:hypothetical protein
LDEFYSHYVWNGPAPISAAAYVEDVDSAPVLVIDGLTKNYRYPGWRPASTPAIHLSLSTIHCFRDSLSRAPGAHPMTHENVSAWSLGQRRGVQVGYPPSTSHWPLVTCHYPLFSEQVSAAAAGPGMSAALRPVGLLGVLSSAPAGPSVASGEHTLWYVRSEQQRAGLGAAARGALWRAGIRCVAAP